MIERSPETGRLEIDYSGADLPDILRTTTRIAGIQMRDINRIYEIQDSLRVQGEQFESLSDRLDGIEAKLDALIARTDPA